MHGFKRSLNELTSFAVVFLVLLMSFVQAFYILMNNESTLFSSLAQSIYACFQIILGKFDANTFYTSKSKLSPFLFVAFNIVVVFVMINIFVSILIENFHLACQDQQLDEEDPELLSYLKAVAKSVFFCFKKNDDEPKPVYFDFWDSLPNRFEEILQRYKQVKLDSFLNPSPTSNYFNIKY